MNLRSGDWDDLSPMIPTNESDENRPIYKPTPYPRSSSFSEHTGHSSGSHGRVKRAGQSDRSRSFPFCSSDIPSVTQQRIGEGGGTQIHRPPPVPRNEKAPRQRRIFFRPRARIFGIDLRRVGAAVVLSMMVALCATAEQSGFFDGIGDDLRSSRDLVSPDRATRVELPFDDQEPWPKRLPGVALFFLIVFVASMLSEDLTCIGVGLLIGEGRIGFAMGVSASVFALVAGDLLLYAAGRWLSLPVLRHTPLRKFLTSPAFHRTENALARRAGALIIATRFAPGTRLPTYLAAGVLRYSPLRFTLWLTLAAVLWTPVLVGLSASLGFAILDHFAWFQGHLILFIALIVAIVLIATRVLLPMTSWRGRRLLLSRFRRFTQWEFWPSWAFYAPIWPWIGWLSLRYGGLRTATLANPGIEVGGLVAESKHLIHQSLTDPTIAPLTLFVSASGPPEVRVENLSRAMQEEDLTLPVVVKPDRGERGRGAEVIRNMERLESRIRGESQDLLVQERVPGEELGAYYLRRPEKARGATLSIGYKKMTAVVGDGKRNLERLILADDRAVCQAGTHLTQNMSRLELVPGMDEQIPLVEIAAHSRGTLFLDGEDLRTPELEAEVDRIARALPGFHLGRLDLRAPSLEHFRRGEGVFLIEYNGITSEPADMYDPKKSLLSAWIRIFAHWKLVFEVGAENRKLGHRPTSWLNVSRFILRRPATTAANSGAG